MTRLASTRHKKAGLRFVAAFAIVLGCSSAALGGALASLPAHAPAGQPASA